MMNGQEMMPSLSEPMVPQKGGGAVSAAATAEESRAIAETQAMMIIAKRFPRNEIQARDKILNACMRPGLAAKSQYEYAKGGTEITGPTIRMAEVMAAAWGNMKTGWRELSRQNGTSEIEAYAWDIESNVYWPITFQVNLVRNTKKGSYVLTDEREIYEMCANQASRRVRACILKLIPGDIVDDAITQCDDTLSKSVDISPEKIKALVAAFAEYKVTVPMIEARIQRRIDTITRPQVVSLGKIFNGMRDGMSKPEDWFDMSLAAPDAAAPKAADPAKAKPTDPKPAAKPKEKPKDTPPPQRAEEAAAAAAAPAVAQPATSAPAAEQEEQADQAAKQGDDGLSFGEG